MNNIQKPIPLAVILIFGPACVAAGATIFAAALGYIPLPPSKDPIPDWWIWVCGTIFLCGGLWFLLVRISHKLATPFGLIAALSFVWIFNWIAFGPGERHFRSKSNVGVYSARSNVSETEGRVVFGLFGGAMDLLIAYGIVVSFRKRK